MEIKKINIRSLNFDELRTFIISNSFPSFRAKQIYEWIWEKSVLDFDKMNNIPKNIRELLNNRFYFNKLKTNIVTQSIDKTIKCAFELYDNKFIEGVLIPTTKRITACVSSQVGCSLNCEFCATGKLKRMRNLSYDEIFDQVIELNKLSLQKYCKPITNIVFMGMGEPLMNYNNVLDSIDILCSEMGLGISRRKIMLSTSGVSKLIRKLADDNFKVNLAVSLHATNNELRNKLMDINKSNPLEELISSLKYFQEKFGKIITFEYLMLDNVNDSISNAYELSKICRSIKSKVNLIEYNSIAKNDKFKKSNKDNLAKFVKILSEKNIKYTIRKSRGEDIDAACGQLANKLL